MDVAGRLSRLRTAHPDPLLVTNLRNIRYLTGFTGTAALLLVTPDGLVFTTDGRYKEQSADQLGATGVQATFHVGGVRDQQDAIAAASRPYDRIGLEAGNVTWAQQRAMATTWFPHAELIPTEDVVEALRRVKDEGEVARIRAAADIADRALAATLPLLDDRPTEAEFGLVLDTEMRRLGASDTSFETIVASGPNGAKPHHRPSSRRIERGDLVVLDFGALVDGYCSDMTRTVSVGPAGAEARRMYDVVRRSQQAGVDAVRAGVPASDVDKACRDLITEAGWGDAFVHGTGHGVGLDIHEAPAVWSKSPDTLAAGHVVTVEPGVYLPGIGGVRIEDTVVVTEEGRVALTASPKELVL
ncbi:MAG TPA: aminopeptidase P family protein [Acidimicrobiales bacterium]|nr:aminopeptidase P family protein [Acidimicrobiales bacterium]